MSGIKLVPEEGGETITVPDASTVIGRGPFLKVTDKRVSRSHALLEVIDGKLHLTPTHTNPCFLRHGGKGGQVVLKRDLRQPLEQGDVFGLLPDQLFYIVSYSNFPSAVIHSNGEARGSVKEAVLSSPMRQRGKKTKAVRKDDKDDEEAAAEDRDDEVYPESHVVNVIRADGKHMALPLTRKRKLPAWMARLSASPTPRSKTKASPGSTSTGRRAAATSHRPAPKRRKSDDDFLDHFEEENEKPARRKTTKSPRTSTKRRKKLDDDFLDEDEEEERPVRRKAGRQRRKRSSGGDDDDEFDGSRLRLKRGGGRNEADEELSPGQRPKRAATQKRGSYVDEFMLGDEFDDSDDLAAKPDSDSDFNVDGNDDPDSTSDTGKGQRLQTKKAGARTPGRAVKRQKGRQIYLSDDDFEESEEEYIPRPSSRRGGTALPGRPTPNSQEDDDDDEEEEEEVKIKVKKPAARSPSKKKKRPCYYGDKCYRRNPDHFKQFSHPGDSDEEENPDGRELTGRDRKEAVQQKVKAKVTPVTKKKTKSEDEEEDDGLPNTYDYNDSFINDTSQSLSQAQRSDDDSDEEAEDIEALKKEAKSFMKNRKMLKAVPGRL